MPHTPRITRRDLLRAAALAPVAGALAACATPAAKPTASSAAPAATSAANPLGVPGDKPLEVWIFDGGFGQDYAKNIHQPLFKAKYPGVEIKHNSTKEITKVLQPRFAGGNPPDVIDNSGANAMDFGALAQDGQLQDLTPLLDAPSWDDPATKVRDTIDPAVVELGTYDGKFSVLGYVNYIFGIWYSQKVFRDNGWEVPRTWDEFLKLNETIKKSGKMAPFTYAGKHPQYLYEPLLTMAAKIGGNEVLVNLDNLEDGAWTAEPMKAAAAAWAEIGAKYLMEGTAGLDHVQTQTAQNKYKVAMLPSGSWLENEQKTTTPDDFEYGMFPLPDVTGSDKLPYGTLHTTPGENFIVPSKGANPRAGMEYLRAMLSKKAAGDFSELVKTVSVVKGAGEGRQLSPGAASASKAMTEAGANTVTYRWQTWYAQLKDEAMAATGQLMSGGLTPDKYLERLQKKADEIKNDSSIKKFRR
ncbi:N-acetylglucosamine/diacetylchitobiose ABC transporter substrate-binding protein [Nonomuraea cavernae]|uniref:Carbohydrate ABC transporter, N-acetylglucosamine/diacetylchitobiose-binding protein n=1 Tax=Nonomuraea cavernae TaxID=2045107 RepID=A0A917Z7P2_9ACTN|nr:N-acetylglucosamine/diacetylchitobiose ABC transporter substrate-binding protein [Nonomuraea cavernae]MCA2189367.1 N-acetylglucosamine/diacetylchitobiose ABC transporter substrate-binding protein [Nonomuraea cavernae]GGO76994.1 carbohydrate ABC transporter, N-acetylglucosamine/diacetylchitobiose-binding protein [Nonomuraea cavernae]